MPSGIVGVGHHRPDVQGIFVPPALRNFDATAAPCSRSADDFRGGLRFRGVQPVRISGGRMPPLIRLVVLESSAIFGGHRGSNDATTTLTPTAGIICYP